MHKYYICKYYLNATHSINNSKEHAHTFTISFWIEKPKKDAILSFHEIDKMIGSYVQKFKGKYLNEEPEFAIISPTLENIAEIIFIEIEKRLENEDVTLVQVEICENPLRIYSVSNKILLPSAYADNLDDNWESILEQTQKSSKDCK